MQQIGAGCDTSNASMRGDARRCDDRLLGIFLHQHRLWWYQCVRKLNDVDWQLPLVSHWHATIGLLSGSVRLMQIIAPLVVSTELLARKTSLDSRQEIPWRRPEEARNGKPAERQQSMSGCLPQANERVMMFAGRRQAESLLTIA